jgi:prolyl-tRNA synthetase
MKGVPVRLAMGPRDLENGTVEIARRDTLEKKVVSLEGIADTIETLLGDIQQNIFTKALDFRTKNITRADTWDEFKEVLKRKGGFIWAHWDGTAETEEQIKAETKATIRCLPLENEQEEGVCVYSGKPSRQRVLFAVSY